MSTSVEYCAWSDLPVYECDHCPPDARQAAQDAISRALGTRVVNDTTVVSIGPHIGRIRSGRNLWASVPTPDDERPKLRLTRPDGDTCACGQPLRDNATGCSDCVAEMERILGDTPWLVEQLDLAITGQRGRSGVGRDGDGLPWNDKASETLATFRNELVTTVRILVEDHDLTWPADTLDAMSRWLLLNVRLLAHHDEWTDTLRSLRKIEGDALRIVDNPPPKVFLGWCDATVWAGEGQTLRLEECTGPVYARVGVETGYCTECRKPYGVIESREALEKALDDQLVTASEIAKLATYLGIEQPRERVRKLVESWRKRNRIEAKGSRDGVPVFRYGEVRPLLSIAYETRYDRSV